MIVAAVSTIAFAIAVPVVVAVLTAVGTLLVTRAGDAANQRRDRYAQCIQTLVAWVELPYRIRRRVDDEPVTLTALASRAHDLQEQLAANRVWIATDSPRLAAVYEQAAAEIQNLAAPFLQEAWRSAPITRAADMVLGQWGPGQASAGPLMRVQHGVSGRFGWRRLIAILSKTRP